MPEGVPATGAYMAAAYIVTAVIILSYTISLYRRSKKL